MPHFLDDFKTNFVNYNLNPQNNEYEHSFQNDKNILNSINLNIIKLVTNVDKNTLRLNDRLEELYVLINEARIENKELKIKLGILDNENETSYELINNYKEMYNFGYLRNWGLALCIIIAGIAIMKVYPSTHVNRGV
jgi:membrane carboxypeptidase/penicillin-binding protein PbpC